MTALATADLKRLLPRGKAAPVVIAEVPAAVGIADIVAVRYDPDALRRRMETGVGPVCSPLRIRLLAMLRCDRTMRVSTVAGKLGSNPRALTRSSLGPLVELGLLEFVGDGVKATGRWETVAAHVTAVELKLSNWKGALRQADNFALSADRSWVVLDGARAGGAVAARETFKAFGVGLALLDGGGALRVISRPGRRRPERWLRALIAERVWATADAEVRACSA